MTAEVSIGWCLAIRTVIFFFWEIVGAGVNRTIKTMYKDWCGFQEKWRKAVIITRLGGCILWAVCRRLMAIFLKKWKKPTICPLGPLSGLAFMESSEELDLLVVEGSSIMQQKTVFLALPTMDTYAV